MSLASEAFGFFEFYILLEKLLGPILICRVFVFVVILFQNIDFLVRMKSLVV